MLLSISRALAESPDSWLLKEALLTEVNANKAEKEISSEDARPPGSV